MRRTGPGGFVQSCVISNFLGGQPRGVHNSSLWSRFKTSKFGPFMGFTPWKMVKIRTRSNWPKTCTQPPSPNKTCVLLCKKLKCRVSCLNNNLPNHLIPTELTTISKPKWMLSCRLGSPAQHRSSTSQIGVAAVCMFPNTRARCCGDTCSRGTLTFKVFELPSVWLGLGHQTTSWLHFSGLGMGHLLRLSRKRDSSALRKGTAATR